MSISHPCKAEEYERRLNRWIVRERGRYNNNRACLHTYLGQRRPLPALKQQTHQGRADRAPGQRPDGQLPPILLFPRARKHAHHDEDDIGRCGQVEELQHKVPPAEPWRHPEEIEIAGGEDEAVEQLGQETDTLGRLVAVNGPDEDAFGGRVRDIAEDAEDVHVEDRSHGGGGGGYFS